MEIRKTSHARYELWYHLAFSTKYRKKVFNDEKTRRDTKELFREIAEYYDLEVGQVEVLPDHVHLTITAPPRIAPAEAVAILKSVSTKLLLKRYRWLRNLYWGKEVWSGGYFVRSIGSGLTKEAIEKYIKEQSEEK
ncbi:MAG: IS200/IS605 family transposase [Candidatus Omnitrophica bacterium]|nr:IS200/IS605 family transposase [Candidatus Omnitrophota bacterium]